MSSALPQDAGGNKAALSSIIKRVFEGIKTDDVNTITQLLILDSSLIEVAFDADNGESMTLLMMAAAHGSHNVMGLLIHNGASLHARNILGKTALHFAAQTCHPKVVQLLLTRGADPTLKTPGSSKERDDGMTPLMLVASSWGKPRHCVAAVRALLQRCNNVNERGPKGATALWIACMNGHEEVTQALLARGADPLIPNNRGVMPGEAARQSWSKVCGRFFKVSASR